MGCCWWDRARLSVQHDRSLGALFFVLFPSAVSQLVSAINGDFTNRPFLGAAMRYRGWQGKKGDTFQKDTTPLLLFWETLFIHGNFYWSLFEASVKISLTSSSKHNNWCIYVQLSHRQALRRGSGCSRLFWSSPAGGACCYPSRVKDRRFFFLLSK